MLAGIKTSPLGDISLPAGQPLSVELFVTDAAGNSVDLSLYSLTLAICWDDETGTVQVASALDTSATAAGNPATAAFAGSDTRSAYAVQQGGQPLCFGIAGLVPAGLEWLRLGRFVLTAGPVGIMAQPSDAVGGGSTVQIRATQSSGALSIALALLGPPGPPQWMIMGFASAAAYDAQLRADAVASVLSATGPIAPTHGISAGGETTLPAPDAVPAASPWWVRVFINGVVQRPGAFTSDGSATLTLAGPLDPGVEWIVEQLQRNPA